jgi:hypothetical protein
MRMRLRGNVEEHERLVWGESDADTIRKSPIVATADSHFQRSQKASLFDTSFPVSTDQPVSAQNDEEDDMDVHNFESFPRRHKRRHSSYASKARTMEHHHRPSQVSYFTFGIYSLLENPHALSQLNLRTL